MRRCRPLLGTFVEIDCELESAIAPGFAAIERIHQLMSAHEPDSDLSRVNRSAHLAPVEVSVETAAVIERAISWSRRSHGAFDVVKAGRSALARGALPAHPGQPRPDPAARWADVSVKAGTVSLRRPACLDLGGIAKGFAVDRAIDAMRGAGAIGALVNAGGDLRAFGSVTRQVVVVEPLLRRPAVCAEIAEGALATSAALPASGGLRFDHLPAGDTAWTSVTVRAENACDADALTKIVWALGHDSAPLLVAARAEAFAIGRDRRIVPVESRQLAA